MRWCENAITAAIQPPRKLEIKMKSGQEKTQIVNRYFTALGAGNFGELDVLFSDDIVWNQPGSSDLSGRYVGKKDLYNLFGQFMERSQGSFKVDQVEDVMVNDNLVAARLKFSATSRSSSISMRGVDLMKIEEGKIVEVHLFSENQAAEDAFWNR
jgi:uncharacterized protein